MPQYVCEKTEVRGRGQKMKDAVTENITAQTDVTHTAVTESRTQCWVKSPYLDSVYCCLQRMQGIVTKFATRPISSFDSGYII